MGQVTSINLSSTSNAMRTLHLHETLAITPAIGLAIHTQPHHHIYFFRLSCLFPPTLPICTHLVASWDLFLIVSDQVVPQMASKCCPLVALADKNPVHVGVSLSIPAQLLLTLLLPVRLVPRAASQSPASAHLCPSDLFLQ